MQGVASLLILAGMAVFCLALAAFFKPLPKLRLGTRKAASVALLLSLGSCVAGGAMMPTDQTDQTAKGESAAEATTPAAKAPDKLDAAEVKTWYAAILAEMQPCETAGKRVAAAGDARDMYALYDAAKSGESACRQTWSALGDFDPPASARGDVRKAFEAAIDDCQMYQLWKQDGFKEMAKVADGASNPSQMSKTKEAVDRGQVAGVQCIAKIFAAVEAGGLPLDTLDSSEGS